MRNLLDEEYARGGIGRPDLSHDARRVLFCMKEESKPAYHLYEINLDGSGLRQITKGHYNDLDPIYAPDGRIVSMWQWSFRKTAIWWSPFASSSTRSARPSGLCGWTAGDQAVSW